ncbi:MAG: hypothetical protein RLZZ568_1425 [Cyanobacteriota bacterium]
MVKPLFKQLGLFLLGLLTVLSPVFVLPTRPFDLGPAFPFTIQGVWLTNVDSNVLYDADHLKTAIADLKATNFNTLYPTVWNDGHTLYPSQVATDFLNQPQDPHPGLQGRDSLAEVIALAKAQNLQVIPWFEFGFMAPAASEWVKAHPDWLTHNAQGETIWLEGKKHPRVWLNPLQPDVQALITALALEIITHYDVDGIQFDDHFGYPSSLGYDPLTVARYRQETGLNPPPPPPLDPNQNCVSTDPAWQTWTHWRSEQITAYLQTLVQTLKAAKPDLIVSVSPNPQTFSKHCFLADWQQWQERGLMDQLVLQIYRDTQTAFERELTDPSVQQVKQQIPVVIGILSGLKNRSVPLDRLQSQTQWVQKNGFAGVAYFFYESLWNLSDPAEHTRQARQTFFQEFRPVN